MEAMKKLVMDCAAKENATPADLEEFAAQVPATSPTAKCHRACMHENFGTVSAIEHLCPGKVFFPDKKYSS